MSCCSKCTFFNSSNDTCKIGKLEKHLKYGAVVESSQDCEFSINRYCPYFIDADSVEGDISPKSPDNIKMNISVVLMLSNVDSVANLREVVTTLSNNENAKFLFVLTTKFVNPRANIIDILDNIHEVMDDVGQDDYRIIAVIEKNITKYILDNVFMHHGAAGYLMIFDLDLIDSTTLLNMYKSFKDACVDELVPIACVKPIDQEEYGLHGFVCLKPLLKVFSTKEIVENKDGSKLVIGWENILNEN